MATNLAIDPQLLQKALEVSGLKTKKETVNLALKEFINRHKQLEVLELFGKMDPDPDYDYKKGRTR
ncbi:MAG: type II toxin-antitoxin system VapB family antitoxin [Thermodesulfobacteriota bacterium]|nr:type II toxin-antitoxin system VapB family antitoxin [Thermodesulfobacteriota bacterium]